MTRLFYEPKKIYQRKKEPRVLICMRISCLSISMIILIAYSVFLIYSNGIAITSVTIPKPYIPVNNNYLDRLDLIITAKFSFSMDCQFRYLDNRIISQTDKDLCLNYIVPTICDEPDPNDLSKSRCIGKFQVPTELLDAPITERLNFSLPDKRYGIQFLINITDAEYNPKYDNGIVIKAYDQEFNPHRLPEAVGNLVNKLDPYFIERLDSLNFHIMTYHQTREFLITSFWEMLGLPPYYFLQPYIDSRIEYIRIPSIIDQFATSNYGILFVGTLNWIETIEMPWGICQRSCCSSGSKAKLCKKFESRGIPLMPSTTPDKDVSGLMEFLGPILLRSTNSIKKDEENDTPNSSTTKISLPPTEDKNRLNENGNLISPENIDPNDIQIIQYFI
ncbi:17946_t:CDS:2 [Entrophospora sp. SA101]|nr:17946_t:CDS:2 [Entrophospora sp. SA101]